MITLKDRCGHFEEGADVARLVGSLDVGETLFMRIEVQMPTVEQQADDDTVLLGATKDRILALVAKHGPSKKRDLQSGVTTKQRPKFTWALEELLGEGRLVEKDGKYQRADSDDH